MKSVFGCIIVSIEYGDNIYVTYAKRGVANLVGATHCSCFKPSGVWIGERKNCAIIIYGRVCSQTNDSPVNWGS